MRVVVGPVAEAHLMQQLPGSGLDIREDVFFAGPEIRTLLGQKLAGQHHILEGRVLGKEVEGLKDQTEMEPFLPDLALPPGGRISGVEEDLVPDGDAPLVRRLQEIKASQKRGLAGAGGADDGQGLAGIQREADVPEHFGIPKGLADM